VPRALVTGATGLVGSHIVERLRAEGWEVRALVRQSRTGPGTAPPASSRHDASSAGHRWLIEHGVELATGDVLDADSFARAAAGCDAVFHTAAAITPRGGWEAFRRVNVDGTRNAIDAAASAGARLLHLSSVAVYGPEARYSNPAGSTDETTPLPPLPEAAYYARSKRESEELVMQAHRAGRIWATAVRPCVIYGPRDRQFVPRVGRIVRTGFAPRVGSGNNRLAIVHAAHVADGAVRALMHASADGQAFNLANDFDVTTADFLRLAGAGIGVRVKLVPIPVVVARGALVIVKGIATLAMGGGASAVSGAASLEFLTRDNPFSSERARRELGWSPSIPPREGIPAAFRWWKENRSAR
jgi:nucleoside-diphosphate-sugar epimerase